MLLPFISTADLQAYLKLPTGLIDPDLATISIDAGCQAVVDWLNQELETTTITSYSPDIKVEDGAIILPNFPIQEVASLSNEGNAADLDGFRLFPSSGMLIPRTGSSVSLSGEYAATYTYGYDEIPSTPRMVAMQIAMRIYEFAMYRQETIGPLQASYASGEGQLTENERDALFPYRTYI